MMENVLLWSAETRHESCCIPVAVTRSCRIRQFDIKTAFLTGQVHRKLYTAEPKGFETGEGNMPSENDVVKLRAQGTPLFSGNQGIFIGVRTSAVITRRGAVSPSENQDLRNYRFT